MRLIPNWKNILLKGWSIRIALLTYVLVGLSALWPALDDVISPYLFFGIGVPLFVIARLLDQGLEHES